MDGAKQRVDLERYDTEMSAYNHQPRPSGKRTSISAMRQGWILVDYFYGKLGQMEKESISLKDDIGEMVYGMDVDRERHHATQIEFLPEGTHDLVRRVAPPPTGLQVAEMKMLKGDPAGAGEIAQKMLGRPQGRPRGRSLCAGPRLHDGAPARGGCRRVQPGPSDLERPPHLAWSHIYMGVSTM